MCTTNKQTRWTRRTIQVPTRTSKSKSIRISTIHNQQEQPSECIQHQTSGRQWCCASYVVEHVG